MSDVWRNAARHAQAQRTSSDTPDTGAGTPLTAEDRDEAMTFVPAWVRDALNYWFLHPGIESADDLRSAVAEWQRETEEPDHD